MRAALEEIERIEKYIQGSLTESEKLAFENQLETDAEFKDKYENQLNLVRTLRRVGYRKETQLAERRYFLMKKLFFIGKILLVVVLGLTIYWGLTSEKKTNPPIQKTDVCTQPERTRVEAVSIEVDTIPIAQMDSIAPTKEDPVEEVEKELIVESISESFTVRDESFNDSTDLYDTDDNPILAASIMTVVYSQEEVDAFQEAIYHYIARELASFAKDKGIKGKIYTQIDLDVNTHITNVKVLKGINSEIDQKVREVLLKMPDVDYPFTVKEEPTRIYLPIQFRAGSGE